MLKICTIIIYVRSCSIIRVVPKTVILLQVIKCQITNNDDIIFEIAYYLGFSYVVKITRKNKQTIYNS